MSAARLLFIGAPGPEALASRIEGLRSELGRTGDLAAIGEEWSLPGDDGPLRAAVVGTEPKELASRLDTLGGWVPEGNPELRADHGLVLATVRKNPRVGFVFPGQGAPVPSAAGAVGECLPEVTQVYERARALGRATEVPPPLVQLAIVTASVAGLRALAALGIDASFAVGHSVGELTALHWAGALDEAALLRLARRRGEVMTEHATAHGTMANIEAEEEAFAGIIDGSDVTVACFNSPRNRVVSGATDAVEAVVQRAREHDGARVVQLRVVGAFHSPLMREAVPVFDRYLAEEEFGPVGAAVHSTITGTQLDAGDDLRGLLVRQMTEPVQFLNAVQNAVEGTDLLLEVGPGRMLSGLVSEFSDVPSLPLRVGHSSPQAFLTAVGAAYAIGAPVRADRLRCA